jgi:hypothetical protein
MDATQAAASEYLLAVNTAVMRAALLAGELAAAREQIKALTQQLAEQKPPAA